MLDSVHHQKIYVILLKSMKINIRKNSHALREAPTTLCDASHRALRYPYGALGDVTLDLQCNFIIEIATRSTLLRVAMRLASRSASLRACKKIEIAGQGKPLAGPNSIMQTTNYLFNNTWWFAEENGKEDNSKCSY